MGKPGYLVSYSKMLRKEGSDASCMNGPIVKGGSNGLSRLPPVVLRHSAEVHPFSVDSAMNKWRSNQSLGEILQAWQRMA